LRVPCLCEPRLDPPPHIGANLNGAKPAYRSEGLLRSRQAISTSNLAMQGSRVPRIQSLDYQPRNIAGRLRRSPDSVELSPREDKVGEVSAASLRMSLV